MTIIQKMHVFV